MYIHVVVVTVTSVSYSNDTRFVTRSMKPHKLGVLLGSFIYENNEGEMSTF